MNTFSDSKSAHFIPLSRSLLTWFVLLALIPLIIVGTFAYYYMAKGLLQSSAESLMVSSSQTHESIQTWLVAQKSDLDAFSNLDAVKLSLEANTGAVGQRLSTDTSMDFALNELLLAHPDIVSIGVVDLQGQFVYLSGRALVADNDHHFNEVLSSVLSTKKLMFSDLYPGASVESVQEHALSETQGAHHARHTPFFSVLARPVYGTKQQLVGVIGLELDWAGLLSLLDNGQMHYLVGKDGLLRSPIESAGKGVLDRADGLIAAENDGWSAFGFYQEAQSSSTDSIGIERFIRADGAITLGLQRPMSVFGAQWNFVAEVDYESAIQPAKEASILTTWLVFVLMVSVSMIALWISRRITQPVEILTELSEAVIAGEISKRAHIEAKNEIGVLAHHLNLMLDVREKNENIIQQSYARSEEALLALDQQKFALDQHSIVEITDLDGVITFVNSKCEEITGYQSSELIGQRYSLLNSGEHSEDFWASMYQTISNGGVWRGEICNKSKRGSFYWVDSTIAPFMRDGKPESFIVIRNDITLAKLTELELIEAKNAAEDGTKAKSDFLASMSHEIRTPMNGVLGMLNLLMKTPLDEGQRRQAQLAYGSAESLLTIINDILDFSKIEAGKLELEEMEFNLRDMFSEFAASIAPRIYEKDLEFVLDVRGIDRDKVKGDPGRLRQVLINLVGNAIKFTEHGEIKVQASLLESYNKRLKLECVISDTGIGIPEEQQHKLFESFSQVDASTTRKYGGTGLGLTIVKQLCELMGGQVFAESQEGKGSDFTFSIYFEPAEDARLLADEGEALIGQRVLVVDDNAPFVENICAQLEEWKVVATGVDSLNGWNTLCSEFSAAQELFDIMLVKQCREGESNSLFKQVMNSPEFAEVPKVAMTQISAMSSREDLRADGYVAGLTKPCLPDELLKTLVYLVLGQSSSISLDDLVDEAAASEASLREKLSSISEHTQILLVEDNPVNQIVASSLLEQVGLSCDMAGNGKEAITALRRSPAEALYDVLLMDCQMPEMDGYEATRQIREGLAGERYKNVAIIAMTANAMKGDREKCLAAGMDDYISKPVSAESLEQTLAKWLIEAPKMNQAVSQVPGLGGNDSVSLAGSHAEQGLAPEMASLGESVQHNVKGESAMEPVWDKQSALDNLAGSEEIYDSLLEASLLDIPENIERLEQAISAADLDMARISAHSVKGVAASIGAMLLMESAKQAEIAAREQNLDEVSSHLPSIIEKFEEFKEAVDA